MRLATFCAIAAAAVVPATAAAAPPHEVSIRFQAFAPADPDILPGEAVTWNNVSERTHTVTAGDAAFDSGEIAGGASFSHTFAAPGSFPYHCTLHPTMTGTVDVRHVILDPLPPAAVPAGQMVTFSGRTDGLTSVVRVQRVSGGTSADVASVRPSPDGRFSVPIAATTTGDYRAALGADSSQERRLLVTDRSVHVTRTRAGIRATVSPAAPNALVILQLELRERFGWWPQQRVRLDYLSRADFVIPRGVVARVALADRDGWTALSTSREIRIGRPKAVPLPAPPRAAPPARHGGHDATFTRSGWSGAPHEDWIDR